MTERKDNKAFYESTQGRSHCNWISKMHICLALLRHKQIFCER